MASHRAALIAGLAAACLPPPPVAGATTNGPGVDNRFQSPGAPIAAFAGMRAQF